MGYKLQKDCPPFLRANLQLQLPDNLHSQFLTQGEHCFVRPYWPTISLKCCASFSWKLSFVAKRTLDCPSFSCQRQSSPVFWPINLKWSFKNKILRGSRLKIGGCPRSFHPVCGCPQVLPVNHLLRFTQGTRAYFASRAKG